MVNRKLIEKVLDLHKQEVLNIYDRGYEVFDEKPLSQFFFAAGQMLATDFALYMLLQGKAFGEDAKISISEIGYILDKELTDNINENVQLLLSEGISQVEMQSLREAINQVSGKGENEDE
jgi:hypothetical protein